MLKKEIIRILIPVFNEEENVKKCIDGVADELDKLKYNYKFYIVNDGSSDNTLNALRNLKKKYNIKILNHPYNLGILHAFRTGFKSVAKESKKKDVVVLMEGDNTSTPGLLPKMIKEINNNHDIVIASRYKGSGRYKNFPLYRTVLSLTVNFTLRVLFNISKVKDFSIFYRAYKAEIIKKLLIDCGESFITSSGFVANTELLINLMRYNPKIKEIPFVYNYGLKKGRSGINILKNIRAYFYFLVRRLIINKLNNLPLFR